MIRFFSNGRPSSPAPLEGDTLRLRGGNSAGWSLALAAALVCARINSASAQDAGELGYRHETYSEENGRMNIGTDSWLGDVPLNTHIDLKATYVIDAISGATPNGAPPQTSWPFPSFNSLYKGFYTPAFNAAYPGQFNQYIANNFINVTLGLETAQQLTNAAMSFATNAAKSIAGTTASNSARSTLRSISNNPNFRNSSVPLTHLHDHREAWSASLPITSGVNQFTPIVAYSRESDYKSVSGAMDYARLFNQKNTTLNIGYSHNYDKVRNHDFIFVNKNTDDVLAGVTQLLNPKTYVTVNLELEREYGYLDDPYRGVIAEENFVQLNPSDPALIGERRPRERNSQIAFGSITHYFDPVYASLEASYRFFHDTYNIQAHTVDLSWHQKIGHHLVISPSFRYYYQTQASFYYIIVPDANNLPPAFSSDYRLSKLQSFTYGIDITYQVFKHLSLDASYMRYVMEGLDGATSQSAYPTANVINAGLRIWF